MLQVRLSACLALLMLGIGLAAPVAATGATIHGLFGSIEFRTAPLKTFERWDRVRREMRADRPRFALCAASYANCPSPRLQQWGRLVRDVADLTPRQKLTRVNRFFNTLRYRSDAENYGVGEYWASPAEFMSRSGDCEDYALAKFFTLRLLGFRNDQMRIVIVSDKRRAINHVVLAVYQDDQVLILDNVSNRLDTQENYPHYAPRLSFNETGHWAHLSKRHLVNRTRPALGKIPG